MNDNINLINDLQTLQSIPVQTIDMYWDLMAHRDCEINKIIIVTATRTSAMRRLTKLGEDFLSGKINMNKLTLEAPNGNVIKFIPVNSLRREIPGQRFKEIHFER